MKEDMKKWITLILVAILAYWTLNNISILINAIKFIFDILLPFILGGVMAFILNIPLSKIENFLNNKTKLKKGVVRGISITLSILLFLLIIGFVAFLLIPELIENIKLLIQNIPLFINKIENSAINLLDQYPEIQLQINNMIHNISIGNILSNVLNYFVNGALGFISNLISGFVTFFTGLIFAIYMLSQKEYLIRNIRKVVYAIFNNKTAKKIENVAKLTNKTFNKFITGQCLEAVILGVIIFVVSTICGFPYALIISVLTAITALIPIFGAIIAMVIGAILIGITDIVQAVIFIVVFQIIQQIEGNVIYPKVVGASVGLSPLVTLFAISVGGSLFGVVGMIIALPIASVLFTLFKKDINKKLNEKELKF